MENLSASIIKTNMMIRNIITSYLDTNQMSFREYAKQVGIPFHLIMSLQRGIINITDLPFHYVITILQFHNYNLYMGLYDTETKEKIT